MYKPQKLSGISHPGNCFEFPKRHDFVRSTGHGFFWKFQMTWNGKLEIIHVVNRWCQYIINGKLWILKWRYVSTICGHLLLGYSLKFRPSTRPKIYLVGGFGPFFIFHDMWDSPSYWLSYFSEGWLNHQPDMVGTSNQSINRCMAINIMNCPP